jgi:uncharacterized protein (TIGR03086 family)
MELVNALDQTFDHAYKVIGGVRPAQYNDPTPCEEWNVQQLLTHIVGVTTVMGETAASGKADRRADSVALGDDPAAQFRAAADAALAGWRKPGIMDETINGGPGPMPGRVLAGINLLDTATHSWDLATATGQSTALPPAVAEAALEASHQIVNDQLRSGRFVPEVQPPPDCGPTDRLVAFLGRQP